MEVQTLQIVAVVPGRMVEINLELWTVEVNPGLEEGDGTGELPPVSTPEAPNTGLGGHPHIPNPTALPSSDTLSVSLSFSNSVLLCSGEEASLCLPLAGPRSLSALSLVFLSLALSLSLSVSLFLCVSWTPPSLSWPLCPCHLIPPQCVICPPSLTPWAAPPNPLPRPWSHPSPWTRC